MLCSFNWLRPALGFDGGLASVVKAGDLVQHRNGGQWGLVLRVVSQRDGAAELEIQGICRPDRSHDNPSVRWWATYHISAWEPAHGPVRQVQES